MKNNRAKNPVKLPDPDRQVGTGQSTRHHVSRQGPEDSNSDRCILMIPSSISQSWACTMTLMVFWPTAWSLFMFGWSSRDFGLVVKLVRDVTFIGLEWGAFSHSRLMSNLVFFWTCSYRLKSKWLLWPGVLPSLPCAPIGAFPWLGGLSDCSSCPVHVTVGLLLCGLHGAALEHHLEATAGSKYNGVSRNRYLSICLNMSPVALWAALAASWLPSAIQDAGYYL